MRTELPFNYIDRKTFVRREVETSDKFGEDPWNRDINTLLDYGIVNIDKPSGPTSHQVSAYVQKILNIEKAGHSGTLDPKVTGVLPIALGRGTRIVQALLNAGKEYICLLHLHKSHNEKEIRKVVKKFTGKLKQMPPVKSSVKRQWRYRKVYYANILDIQNKEVLIQIGCQAGTYIRKWVHDLGKSLGSGAHMVELRRTKAAGLNEDSLCTLQDLTDAFYYYKQENNEKYLRHLVKPIEFAVKHLPKVWVLDSAVNALCHGINLAVPGVSKVESDIQVGEQVAVMTLKNELISLGNAKMISKDIIKKEKGIAITINKVFMLPNTYPRMME